jgi:hypothetical protein
VFGEMPTPISWQGKHGIAPNDCTWPDNPIQSSFVSTISEQNLDGRPQLYGLHNLNRQSIFLADEIEHNYFTLPADYPLEQTTPPISPSVAEHVSVTPQPSVAAQAAGLATGTTPKPTMQWVVCSLGHDVFTKSGLKKIGRKHWGTHFFHSTWKC